ncbi:hypothetical protein V493_01845 [Pseudogymnoascus sp. VKM F-4281 (FW-2241)]|nr:hypothetical protein V493_01845 [Pseudogymnoascus sp. VKM F-4281 (FW-2241)]
MGHQELNNKKRNRNGDAKGSQEPAIYGPGRGRSWTTSLAIPGNIIDMDASLECRSIVASHIARAISTFRIDEVIILSTSTSPLDSTTASTDSATFLLRLLSYLETPPYMRDRLFQPGKSAIHPDLAHISTLSAASTALPHHASSADTFYREGVTLKAQEEGTYHRLVNCGLPNGILASIPDPIPKSTRVSLKLSSQTPSGDKTSIPAEVVAPSEPREEIGQYLGYETRTSPSLVSLFEDCPYDGGYDISILVSDSDGDDAGSISAANSKFQHILLAFGGTENFEELTKNDPKLGSLDLDNFADLFDHTINVTKGLPFVNPGSLRIEELVLVGLAGLKPLLAEQYR